MTSYHAGLGHKWTKIRYVVDCSILKQIVKEKRQIEGNQILYKMTISISRTFGVLTPKIPKMFFLIPKPNFKKKLKTGINVGDLHGVILYGKFQVIPSIFGHQAAPLSVQCHDVKMFHHNL